MIFDKSLLDIGFWPLTLFMLHKPATNQSHSN